MFEAIRNRISIALLSAANAVGAKNGPGPFYPRCLKQRVKDLPAEGGTVHLYRGVTYPPCACAGATTQDTGGGTKPTNPK